jgi:hypothetical protein
MEKCNGWTNYATWRINLEILSDMEFDEQVSADYLEDLVEDCVFTNAVVKDCLAADYARAFIARVNFHEIAESINAELQTNYEY